ncbi:MAG: hypothetical protein HY752_02645 [Nitrospirae bacterium]|nr:hypothetical protein [Nitrospirota bacterium]
MKGDFTKGGGYFHVHLCRIIGMTIPANEMVIIAIIAIIVLASSILSIDIVYIKAKNSIATLVYIN